jgi:hypothetical protein
MSEYLSTFETTIVGIPCQIAVTDFTSVKGSFDMNASSDLDYHGYTECDYLVLDRKGYKAGWLEKKITRDIDDHIKSLILDEMIKEH